MTDLGRQRVLLVDDDIELTGMLTRYLRAEGFEVEAVHDGEQGAVRALAGFDAVILDVMLPRLSGTKVLEEIRESSDLPVIMLTAKGDDLERAVGIELGADDYVAKPYFPRELVARLRAVLRRHGARREAATNQVGVGPIQLDTRSRQVMVEGLLLDLTFCEYSLLQTLIEANEEVVSKEHLSQHVLGRPLQSFDRSIDVHVSNLRHKLSGFPRITIETVRKVGYRLIVP